jgi:hypothetical protein
MRLASTKRMLLEEKNILRLIGVECLSKIGSNLISLGEYGQGQSD